MFFLQFLGTLPNPTSDFLLQDDRHLDAFHNDNPLYRGGAPHHKRYVQEVKSNSGLCKQAGGCCHCQACWEPGRGSEGQD